jgi:hypothetical protein
MDLSRVLRFEVLNTSGKDSVEVEIPRTKDHLYALVTVPKCRELVIRLRSGKGDWLVKSILRGETGDWNLVSLALRTDRHSFDELSATCKGSEIKG